MRVKELTKKEKTIEAVKERILYATLFHDEEVDVPVKVLNDVIDAFNEETIPVYWNTKMNRWWECKECSNMLNSTDKFCSECGKRINWDKEENEND